jgi:hypothetical protein
LKPPRALGVAGQRFTPADRNFSRAVFPESRFGPIHSHGPMNNLPKSKQTEIVAALCEGVGVRATARLSGTNRKTVARVAIQVGHL